MTNGLVQHTTVNESISLQSVIECETAHILCWLVCALWTAYTEQKSKGSTLQKALWSSRGPKCFLKSRPFCKGFIVEGSKQEVTKFFSL